MILPVLMTLALLSDPPAAVSAPVVAPVDPVIAEIDRLMTAWQGRPGDPLKGRLGLSSRSATATDGEVVFWIARLSPGAICRTEPATGAFRCDRGAEAQCQLAVAFDRDRKVKTWKAQGAPGACQRFIGQLGPP